MKILVQWSQRFPQDWVEVNLKDLRKLPYNLRGYINRLNVQGIDFVGYDHYAVKDLPGGAWNTRQTMVYYAEGEATASLRTTRNTLNILGGK